MSIVQRRGGSTRSPVQDTPATPTTRGTAGTTATTPSPSTVSTRGTADGVDAPGRAAPIPPGSGTSRASAVHARGAFPVAPGVDVGTRGLVVDGQRVERNAGITQVTVGLLTEAARRMEGLDKPAFRGLTEARRQAVAEQASLFLQVDSASSSRDASTGLKARAAGWAILHHLVRSIPSRDGPAARELSALLLDAAGREKHAGLRQHMIAGLASLGENVLSAAQVRTRDALVAELAPAAPPYEKWFGGTDKPVFRVKQYAQDEFWKGELAAYRAMGFTVTPQGEHRAVAVKVLKDPAGRHPDVTARVELEQRDSNVFDALGDKDVHAVIYTGHSQLGAVGKLSAEKAPRMEGDKLVAMLACRTQQNLPALHRHFPGANILVSQQGTFAHDDRMLTATLFDGIAARSTWAAMEKSLEKQGPWEKDNYIFPHDRAHLGMADRDRDGRADVSGGRPDVLFNVDVKARNQGSISFKPSTRAADPATLDGAKVMDAVAWFNTEFHYWAEDLGNAEEKRRGDRFVADGWFRSSNPDEMVRVVKAGTPDNPAWRVQVNAAYAHLSADAVAMMVTHEVARAVTAETRPHESEHVRRMRALAMTGAYVNLHVEFSDVADHLLRNFAPRMGYPQTLSWPVVEKAMAADGKVEASEKHIRAFEKGLQFPFLEVNPARSSLAFRTEVMAALEQLRDSRHPIGRATFDAIVSGRVKVDTLTDLTRDDFMRLRREMLPTGVDIKVEDFMKLHDDRNAAMRAITSSIDGYMWDDRIYITPGRPPRDLASTLVHEVNHVLNRSEENYRGPRAVLLEEYRAHLAEELFRTGKKPTAARARAIKEDIISNYGLKGVTPADVPDVPPGVMVPA